MLWNATKLKHVLVTEALSCQPDGQLQHIIWNVGTLRNIPSTHAKTSVCVQTKDAPTPVLHYMRHSAPSGKARLTGANMV